MFAMMDHRKFGILRCLIFHMQYTQGKINVYNLIAVNLLSNASYGLQSRCP